MRVITLLAFLICSLQAADAKEEIKDTHYFQITLLRAAPGLMPSLIEQVKLEKKRLNGELLIMRHSQGDHWDLMLMGPTSEELPEQVSFNEWADFQHNFIASAAVSWEQLEKASDNQNLFHIEMFQAANGAYANLLEQRKMENNYLEATSRKANYIFETRFGTDVDMFTLGIYENLQAFAAEPELPEEAFEVAAIQAGFKSRSDIGFYLREFLVGHQDTFATQIK